MRWIDADALKEFAYINKGNFNTVEGIREWIDNAPTVDCIEFNRAKELIKQAYQKGKDIRPQGEWIKNDGKDIRDNFYTCSECGRTINVICGETLADYPFCHCGAKMKGGKEMTNTEAIKEIQHWIDSCPFEDTKEAFELAIKALEFIDDNYPNSFIDYLNGVGR